MSVQASFQSWSIFWVMAVANLLSSMQQVGLATVSGDVALSFQADAAALGLLSASFTYPYAAMQIPTGILVDTIGTRKTVTIGLFCAALGTVIFALASSFTVACAGRVLTGLALLVSVPLMKVTAVWFPPFPDCRFSFDFSARLTARASKIRLPALPDRFHRRDESSCARYQSCRFRPFSHGDGLLGRADQRLLSDGRR